MMHQILHLCFVRGNEYRVVRFYSHELLLGSLFFLGPRRNGRTKKW